VETWLRLAEEELAGEETVPEDTTAL
jgi:hypothetical protein